MKKKILALCLVVVLAITAVTGATLAYFTDEAEITNTFTVGDVEINLFESYVSRGNSRDHAEHVPADMYPEFVSGRDHTDEQIKEGAANYDKYFEAMSPIVPGEVINKMAFVENTGKNDAYVRVRVLIPASMTEYLGWTECTTGRTSGEWSRPEGIHPLAADASVTLDDGITYDVYTYTRNKALEPGQMTRYQVLDNIYLAAWTDEDDVANLNGNFNVIFQADAIQADGFKDAASAFAAFDNAESTYAPNGYIKDAYYAFTWEAEEQNP